MARLNIHKLMYVSRCNLQPGVSSLQVLRSIVTSSTRNNVRVAVTGFLMMHEGHFIQILEGPLDPVRKTFRRIEPDLRHADVAILDELDGSLRDFPEWSMAGALKTVDHEEIFLSHGVGRGQNPRNLKAAQVLALAKDLHGFTAARRELVS